MKKQARSVHYLRPNHGSMIPTNIVFISVKGRAFAESQDGVNRVEALHFGIADAIRIDVEDGRRWQRLEFTTADQFWAWFVRRHRANSSLWLVGYGIARTFTLLDGWQKVRSRFYTLTPNAKNAGTKRKDFVPSSDFEAGWYVDKDPPTIVLLHTQSCTVHVVDIQNYGKPTLDEMAECVELELPATPDDTDNDEVWREFLTLQTRVIRRYFERLIQWWKGNDYGVWRHTVAGLAMSAFRHKFMENKILIHNYESALKLERASLVGGEFRAPFVGRVVPFEERARVFQTKGNAAALKMRCGPVRCYDVNSMYAHVMRDNVFPAEIIAGKPDGSFDDYDAWSSRMCVIAHVEIDTPELSFPLWYERERWYARGRFWTTLCGPELAQAVGNDLVKNWGAICAYWPRKLFGPYVRHFHGKLVEAERAGRVLDRHFHKMLLTNLAGKFGQKSAEWEFVKWAGLVPVDYGHFPCMNEKGEVKEFRNISGFVQEKQAPGEALNNAPAIEAYVNSYARVWMRSVLEQVGSDHVVYLGNDCLHVLAPGWARADRFLETFPGELGKFKVKWTAERCEYRGPHDYTYDGNIVCAGRMLEAEDVAEGVYEQVERDTLATIQTREPGPYVRIRKVLKKFGHYHARGIVWPDNSVTPPEMRDGILCFRPARPKREPRQPAGKRK